MIINKIILLAFILIAANLVIAQEMPQKSKIYSLTLGYNNGVINNYDTRLTYGYPSDTKNQPEKGYSLEVKSFDDKILYKLIFEFPLILMNTAPPPICYDDEGNINYTLEICRPVQFETNSTNITLNIPYFDDAKEINIYSPDGKKELTIDVSEFSLNKENMFKSVTKEEEQTSFNQLYIFIIGIIFIPLIVFIFRKYKRKQEWKTLQEKIQK